MVDVIYCQCQEGSSRPKPSAESKNLACRRVTLECAADLGVVRDERWEGTVPKGDKNDLPVFFPALFRIGPSLRIIDLASGPLGLAVALLNFSWKAS